MIEPRLIGLTRAYGAEAPSFQGLESGMRHWFDAPPPEGTGGCVSYVDTGGAWVSAGSPLAPADEVSAAAARFVAAARRAGRRASFFASERRLSGLRAVPVGEQPVIVPDAWLALGARSRGMREQLRRCRRKGVRVRRVEPAELREGSPLRREVERLADRWLATRPMEPMGFLVALEPFLLAEEHRYYLAERDGHAVAFLSAVPLYARRGWLVEDVLRSPSAPNGTTESLLVAFVQAEREARVVTLGLAPLSGRVPVWQRAARALGRPLYDFGGLRSFKERLHPTAWEPVWLAFPEGERAIVHLHDALRAFAQGSLRGFAARSILRHPAGPPWVISLLLAAWTAVLGALGAVGRAAALGMSSAALGTWVLFDALVAVLLFRIARRPRAAGLAFATALAAADAVVFLAHLVAARPPRAVWHAALRVAAMAAPIAGALALGWATVLRARLARARGRLPGC